MTKWTAVGNDGREIRVEFTPGATSFGAYTSRNHDPLFAVSEVAHNVFGAPPVEVRAPGVGTQREAVEQRDTAVALLRALVDEMERWGSEGDGIPVEFSGYDRAVKFIEGRSPSAAAPAPVPPGSDTLRRERAASEVMRQRAAAACREIAEEEGGRDPECTVGDTCAAAIEALDLNDAEGTP